MTATLDDVIRSKRPEPTAEEAAATELVRLAREQGLSLTGPDGLLKQLTKTVIETALNEEMTGHLGYEKHDPAGQGAGSGNVRNGTRPKQVLTDSTGQVQIDVPRDRAGTFEPQIVRKRQRRLTGVAGAEIAAGDLDVPASIDDAMTGVSAVVLVSPAVPAQELNVVASAARAGVAHVVKATSKASADSPIARRRGQTQIEEGLSASRIPHTLLRSNAYMQNVLALAPAIAATSSFGSAAGKGRVPEPVAQQNAQAFSLIADGDAEWITDDVPAILGRPARSFEQFAADHAAAFS